MNSQDYPENELNPNRKNWPFSTKWTAKINMQSMDKRSQQQPLQLKNRHKLFKIYINRFQKLDNSAENPNCNVNSQSITGKYEVFYWKIMQCLSF